MNSVKYLLFYMELLNYLFCDMFGCILGCYELTHISWSSTPRPHQAVTQLALRRWPNVNPYVGPTSAHRRWANVDLSIGPTLARQRWANVGTTSAQRWHTNVGPTLAQHCANGCMPTLYQHWPNGGCVTGFLSGEPIGHRWIPLTKGQERWR